MMRSIRLRLVVSYVGLTVLTVGLMSGLALWLVYGFVTQREVGYLSANAEVVAQQVAPLLTSRADRVALEDLARTAAFLGNTRVRILDQQRETLADAGPQSMPSRLLTAASPEARAERVSTELSLGALSTSVMPGEAVAITVIKRSEGQWGSRFTAEEVEQLRAPSPSQPTTIISAEARLTSRASIHLDGANTGANAGASTHASVGSGGLLSRPTGEAPRSERVVAVPVTAGGAALGYVELSRGPDIVAGTLTTTGSALAVAAAGATALAALAGLLVGRSLTSPLVGLAGVAHRMGQGDLAVRATVSGSDETALLARQFNDMASRLQMSFSQLAAERDALRRFVADASHELRTPITALKTFNELLQDGAQNDSAARAEFLAESAAQLGRLERITHDLLDLSRLDGGVAALDLEEHSIAEIIQEATASVRRAARERAIMLAVARAPLGDVLCCDRRRIETAIRNLLENALKHTAAGGEVAVGAEHFQTGDQAWVRLWVRDTGSGIHPDDLPHVFERFFRGRQGDLAASATQKDGVGLGLAIVQSVAHAHGGHATVTSELGEGSTFSLTLPTQ